MSTAPWEEIQAGAGAILERAKAMGIPYHVDPVYQPFLSGAARYTGAAPDGPRPVRRNCIFPGKGLIGYE